jgi:signal transduction histidine kinase
MHLNDLEQLRDYCRDEAAFERLRHILKNAIVSKTEYQRVLFQVITKVRETLDLDTILTTTTAETRQILNADRVAVFRFYPDSGWQEGEFIAEDVLPEFHSALDIKIHDRCFGEKHAVHYQHGRIQTISDIYTAGLSGCHIDILKHFQVRASLAVPLLQGAHLWGLLCIHQCSSPRQWQPDEIEFVSQVAIHLGVALQQAELLEKTQRQSLELNQMLRDLKKSQTQLIQSEKLSSLGRLAVGLTHEINNPANFIHGNLTSVSQYARELLELLALYHQTYPNPEFSLSDRVAALDCNFLVEHFPKMLTSMQMGVERIRQIVLSLHNFLRPDEAELQLVNIHDGIDSILLMLQHRLKPRSNFPGIRIVKNYGQLPPIECYPSQLSQVFMNILSNAIDALEEVQESSEDWINLAEPCQQITIHTGFIPDFQTGVARAIIRIADSGPGIAQSAQNKLFEPFFTTKPIGKGTGLGLSISYQIIVEQHGGVLECYSQPGEGTEFWIEIPFHQTQLAQKPLGTCLIGG